MEEEYQDSYNPNDRVIGAKIKQNLCGNVINMGKNSAKVSLTTIPDMEIESGITHTGFIQGAAGFAALCTINKKNSIIIGCDVKFLAPVETNQVVEFSARATISDMRKCEVKVEGFVLDIKIFDGLFYIVIFDKKLFKLKLKDDKEL